MSFRDLFFPRSERAFPGKRLLSTLTRGLHLLGITGMGGVLLCGAAPADASGFVALALGTGFGLLLLEVWSNGLYLFQTRGLTVLAKVAALLLLGWQTSHGVVFGCLVVLSAMVAHAPARFRHHSVLHGRAVDHYQEK